MPRIPDELIDEIQTRADIAELIGRYVPLKRAGRHFKALCPFHQEKTPSFMVNTEKQIFHCFGCGTGGNVFSFLMQHDRVTFPEAVRQLADHVGVRIPEAPADGDGESQRRLSALMDKICRYFERCLREPRAGRAARAYLERRGVSSRAGEAFRLGFAPAGWNRLLTSATSSGVSVQELEAAGLVIKGRSESHYDRFRHRLMFPILDVRGRVVSFGGRALDGQEPKYLNGPETTLYSKGRHLFGLWQAKDAIIARKTAVLVEGYFDCVVLADAGVSHVVSPLGTALTADQARLLKRYAERVLLAFDADAAGERATLRGIDLLIELGLDVRVANLPHGADPDECLRARGREGFEDLLKSSQGLFEWLVGVAMRRCPVTDAEGKVKAAQFVLPTLAKVPNAMLRSEYVRLLAERLRLDEDAVADELAKSQPRTCAARANPTKPESRDTAHGPERLLTALVLDDPRRWSRVEGRLSVEAVGDATLRRILSAVCELGAGAGAATPARVISRLSGEGHGALVTALTELARSVPSPEAALEDCLERLRKDARKRELEHLREQLRAAQTARRDTDVQRLVSEYQQRLSALPAG